MDVLSEQTGQPPCGCRQIAGTGGWSQLVAAGCDVHGMDALKAEVKRLRALLAETRPC